MFAVTASLCSALMFILFVSADQKIITAESGQNVLLTCRAPNNKITVLKWSRADLVDEYVLIYQDGKFDSDNQHPSFKNRVDLQDRQMKDGNVSLILKDVMSADTGTYECRVFMEETHSWELINSILLILPPDQKMIIKAESGQDVTLTCRAPNNKIIVVKWSRADLGDKNVLLYRDGHFAPATQHPSFKNRVDLQDRQMKDGDVSLILKDVTSADTGTYVCHVFMEAMRSWETINIIHLSVPLGQPGVDTEDRYVGLIFGLSVSLVLLVAEAAFLIYKRKLADPPDSQDRESEMPLASWISEDQKMR